MSVNNVGSNPVIACSTSSKTNSSGCFGINRSSENELQHILPYLTTEELQNIAYLNKSISSRVAAAAKFSEIAIIKNFICVLIQELNEERFSEQRETLVKILDNVTAQNSAKRRKLLKILDNATNQNSEKRRTLLNILDDVTAQNSEQRETLLKILDNVIAQNSEKIGVLLEFLDNATVHNSEQIEMVLEISENNLTNLKGYIFNVKGKLINVINTLDTETAEDLPNNVRFPSFCEDIFALAALERQIDEAHLNLDENERWDALGDISLDLARAGNIGRAIAVARSIPDEYKKGRALKEISLSLDLTRAVNIGRAIDLAESILSENVRGSALKGISQALTITDNIDRAIDVAERIPDKMVRAHAIWEIGQVLTKAGNIGEAIAAKLISGKNMSGRGYAPWAISN